jgi:hypothetical protein
MSLAAASRADILIGIDVQSTIDRMRIENPRHKSPVRAAQLKGRQRDASIVRFGEFNVPVTSKIIEKCW